MLKQLPLAIVLSLFYWGTSMAQGLFTIGSSSVTAPDGWKEVKKSDERLVLRSADDCQQATISVLRFGTNATFDDFKKLCKHRMDAERKELTDGFVQPDEPFKDGDAYGQFFSGGDKKSGRIFSGYFSLLKSELVTVYVEGVGVAPGDHSKTFKAFMTGLKRK